VLKNLRPEEDPGLLEARKVGKRPLTKSTELSGFVDQATSPAAAGRRSDWLRE
jgi:hypothetical protein